MPDKVIYFHLDKFFHNKRYADVMKNYIDAILNDTEELVDFNLVLSGEILHTHNKINKKAANEIIDDMKNDDLFIKLGKYHRQDE